MITLKKDIYIVPSEWDLQNEIWFHTFLLSKPEIITVRVKQFFERKFKYLQGYESPETKMRLTKTDVVHPLISEILFRREPFTNKEFFDA